MPLTYQVASLNMEWCLECHRNAEQFIRPKKEVFTMAWPPETWDESSDKQWHQNVEGPKLVQEYKLQSTEVLTSCSTCHR
jgi:hypothetical protein